MRAVVEQAVPTLDLVENRPVHSAALGDGNMKRIWVSKWRRSNRVDPVGNPTLTLEDELVFAAGGNGCDFLVSGFSYPEEWGTWTIAETATVTAPTSARAPLSIWIEFQ